MASKKEVAIGVVGLGQWGTALAYYCSSLEYQVLGWDRDKNIIKGINSDGRNPKCFSQTKLPSSVKAVSSLEDVFQCNYVILTVASSGLPEVLSKANPSFAGVIISGIKGLTPALKTPLESVREKFRERVKAAVISGPSFAKDVIAGNPCGLVAASRDKKVSEEVADVLASDRMRLYISSDEVGVEYGGIFKNVIALAAGISDGLNMGDSARAGVITRGLAEIQRLAVALGAKSDTLFGLSGLGDLVMTASCDTSRNRTVGLRLGRGEKLEDILASLGSTAEGVRTAHIALKLGERKGIELPITKAVVDILDKKITPKEAVNLLISRPVKEEFE
ncbi:MAG: NAD(P)-dependent glycerol-3-phosphate dehydrogenase [Candidatus Dadabacteria bacterium]|nr:MAG: NAD(P)-dependent glycerol-3-phosphate dehydrogenase [Candidatus Dadabacteria bacterium]